MKCVECNKPAEWVRSTQFAGEHPYCTEHAKKEKDFLDNDSYVFWYQLSPMNTLWNICRKFIEDNKVSCAEVCCEDRVYENAPNLVEDIGNLVGFYDYGDE